MAIFVLLILDAVSKLAENGLRFPRTHVLDRWSYKKALNFVDVIFESFKDTATCDAHSTEVHFSSLDGGGAKNPEYP